MILKSFGCSFIFGTDLADEGHNGPYATGSKLTWPALLAKDLGLDYQTHARPGAGNLQILENILSQVDHPASKIFVVGWSFVDRFDYLESNPTLWPGTRWSTVRPCDNNIPAELYYKNFHSQLKDKLCTLIYIKTAIDTLREHDIPFIMTYTDHLIFETEWHVNPAVKQLQNSIRPYMTTFDGQTFLEFAQAGGHAISDSLHPLESAHEAAFKLIKSYNLI